MPVEMSSSSTLSGLQLPISFVAVGSAESSTHGYCYWAPSALCTVLPFGAAVVFVLSLPYRGFFEVLHPRLFFLSFSGASGYFHRSQRTSGRFEETVPEGGKFQITVGAAQWNPRLADENRKRRPRRGRINFLSYPKFREKFNKCRPVQPFQGWSYLYHS
jgi:hypothetical protein